MKKIFLIFSLFLSVVSVSAQVKISRVEPAFWYAGMKDASLQLMVYGKGVRTADVEVDYPGVRVDSIVRLDSPNYLLVYLNLQGAQPGTMALNFKNGGKRARMKYELRRREMAGEERRGFDNTDVLYMLMPDRFANGSSQNDQLKGMNAYVCDRTQPSLRHGGDLEGIRRHLDYFNELGVTALWLTPVLENNSPDANGYSTYHGYATTDYYRVDPRFGTNEDYARLVGEAHAKGLRVVMDMIFNHCGFEHPWVKDMPSKDWFNTPEWLSEVQDATDSGLDRNTGMASGASAQTSKYLQTSYKLTPVLDPYASKVDLRETVDGWFVPSMPDLNQRNPHVIKYLIQNSEWWIETVGIDGIRMDTYPYADREAMSLWLKTLDSEYPNFNVVGETWVTEPAYTASFQKDSRLSTDNSYLKTVMDFSFFDKLDKAKREETDAWWNGLNRIYNSLVYDYLYEDPSHVLAFIENHDTDRFLGNGQDTLALKQAYALLLTINRIPQLYYGTEVLMKGTKEVTDGNVRKDFPGGFAGDKHDCFTPQGRSEAENAMFSWLSRLLHWRQGNPLVTKGRQTQFIPWKGVYVIARQYEDRTSLTILNGTTHDAVLEVKRYAEVIRPARKAVDVITGREVDLGANLSLSPRQTLIVELQ
ncbi:glycoside hydrolase family 13 protein [Prevotella sp. KH2C16]|uniref:glycoside hydrolase family 13 protein n=1 Tax=Prevotella sp. KH2C16 TaxID=1855325 RepID=UPI0008E2B037|nr:glycoside hydrolase family 13 protein [Prevotella sp. KH2C16]SFG59132.1 Glycosidase [Prevotella sp. KH2C16]